jgi:hypothetical protein
MHITLICLLVFKIIRYPFMHAIGLYHLRTPHACYSQMQYHVHGFPGSCFNKWASYEHGLSAFKYAVYIFSDGVMAPVPSQALSTCFDVSLLSLLGCNSSPADSIFVLSQSHEWIVLSLWAYFVLPCCPYFIFMLLRCNHYRKTSCCASKCLSGARQTTCSFGLSATSQQYFSLRTN